MMKRRIGILGAMPEEINGIVSLLKNKEKVVKGMRAYYKGSINEIEVVVVFSRWGKVASATTVTHLIIEFGVTEIIFTGVAGAINKDLNIGDIVIGSSLVQHDMDARPIMDLFEIPLLRKTKFMAPIEMLDRSISYIYELVNNNRFSRFTYTKTKRTVFIDQSKGMGWRNC